MTTRMSQMRITFNYRSAYANAESVPASTGADPHEVMTRMADGFDGITSNMIEAGMDITYREIDGVSADFEIDEYNGEALIESTVDAFKDMNTSNALNYEATEGRAPTTPLYQVTIERPAPKRAVVNILITPI